MDININKEEGHNRVERRDQRMQSSANAAFSSQPTVYVCRSYDSDCHSRVGLLSHTRRKPLSDKTDGCLLRGVIPVATNLSERSCMFCL